MTDLQRSVAESYRGATFYFKRWELRRTDWNHDHCQLCWVRISDYKDANVRNEGYVSYVPTEPEEPRRVPAGFQAPPGHDFTGLVMTPAPVLAGYAEHWICASCFHSFQDEFDWRLASGQGPGWPSPAVQ